MDKHRGHTAWSSLVAILGVLLLAAFFRLYHLGLESLWNDELATWERTAQPTLQAALYNGAIDSMWPAYHAGLFLLTRVIGYSEFALRLPSALAGIVSVSLIFLMGKYLYSFRAGLISALLMTVSWADIRYSQEARTYSVQVAFVILSMLAWFWLLRGLDRGGARLRRAALLYLAAAAVIIYLQITGLLILGLQGIVAVGTCVWRKRGLGTIIAVEAVVAVLSVPILATVPAILRLYNGWVPAPGTLLDAVGIFLKFGFGNTLRAGLAAVVVCLVGGAAYLIFKSRRPKLARQMPLPATGVLIGWAVLPFLSFYVFSILLAPMVVGRYLFIAQPPLFLLVGWAVDSIPVKPVIQAAGTALLLGLMLYNMLVFMRYYSYLQKPDFRRMVGYVLSNMPTGKRVVVAWYGPGVRSAFDYYGGQALAQSSDIQFESAFNKAQVLKAVQTSKPDYIWYVIEPPNRLIYVDPFRSRFDQVSTTVIGRKMTVSLYQGPGQ